MKLNLLPATVSRGRQTKTAVAVAVIIAVLGSVVAVMVTLASQANLKDAKDAYAEAQPAAARAVATAAQADALMQQPKVVTLVTDVSLAEAMMSHNDAYPDLYNSLRPYIPPYFRLTHVNAVPLSDTQCAVTMTGTLATFQQYADLMLSLMMNKEAVSVARTGYVNNEMYVPQLVSIDQQGRPRRPGAQPVPDDPLDRLAYFTSQPRTPDYQNIGNYGSGTDAARFAMPGESLITVQYVLNRNIQTPNPQPTITAGGGGGAPAGGGFPGIPPGAGPPGGIPGVPPGAGGPPRAGGPPPTTPGGGANTGD